MQDSITIKHFSGYQMDGTVRITADARVLILRRDERGIQQSTIIKPVAKKFGFFVDIPVISAKGKRKLVPFELTELYRFAFPDLPLPESLKVTKNSQDTTEKPVNLHQQQDLFP